MEICARRLLHFLAVAIIFPAALTSVGHAASPRFEPADLERLRRARPSERVRVEDVMLPSGAASLELEEFDVYAPGAVIEAVGVEGSVRRLERPAVRYFRGGVDDDPDSLVFIAVGIETGGFIVARDRKYRVLSRPRVKPELVRESSDFDVVIEEISLTEEMPYDGDVWACEVDDFSLTPGGSALQQLSAAMETAHSDALASSTATYVLNIAVEGDYELYTLQGSSSTATATYLANLVAAASVIYRRDLRTELRIAYSGHHTTVDDPFTIDPSSSGFHTTKDALLEFGRRWHNTPPSPALRSAALLVSGKNYGAGIAWRNWLCQGDFPTAAWESVEIPDGWGGAYGLIMKAGLATNFSPDANANYQTDTDRYGFEYWPVLAFAHELGHTVESRHTHCVPLDASEKALYGVSRDWVDECYSGESGCYNNGFGGAMNENRPPELGTVMSYCHLTTGDPVGYGAATRYTFGRAGEPTIKIVNNMVAALDAKTPALASAITAPGSASSGVAADASAALPGSLTYAWTITNGVINSGASGSTGGGGTFVVNFTPSASPVTLRITATNANGCSASDYVSLSFDSLAAPTNAVATASSATTVAVSWTASAGATSYQVHRSSNGATFAQVGTSGSTSFNDTTAVANTAYLYKVRALDGSANPSAFSNVDLATTVIFADPTLTAGATTIKAAHFSELRTAANAVRTLAGLSASSFTDPTLNSTLSAKAAHLTEIRTSLSAARTALAFPAIAVTDSSPAGVAIKAIHIEELRDGVR